MMASVMCRRGVGGGGRGRSMRGRSVAGVVGVHSGRFFGMRQRRQGNGRDQNGQDKGES